MNKRRWRKWERAVWMEWWLWVPESPTLSDPCWDLYWLLRTTEWLSNANRARDGTWTGVLAL